tara:strand:- start:1038 stop:1241 length:204 start_codon:yes stop_codon:yes gene_type:complete
MVAKRSKMVWLWAVSRWLFILMLLTTSVAAVFKPKDCRIMATGFPVAVGGVGSVVALWLLEVFSDLD